MLRASMMAVRLWSKVEHGARKRHTDAEITQVDLAGLVLELAAWGVDDPAALAFLDPPPAPAWRDGRELLVELGALDERGRSLTSEKFAAEIGALRDAGQRDLCFVIGGADGLDESVRSEAALVFSFGKGPFSHQSRISTQTGA